MKEITFKSKEFVEGVVAATINHYESINGSVSEDNDVEYYVEEKGGKYHVKVQIISKQIDGDFGSHENEYEGDTITLSPSDTLASFIDDVSSILSDLEKVEFERIYG